MSGEVLASLIGAVGSIVAALGGVLLTYALRLNEWPQTGYSATAPDAPSGSQSAGSSPAGRTVNAELGQSLTFSPMLIAVALGALAALCFVLIPSLQGSMRYALFPLGIGALVLVGAGQVYLVLYHALRWSRKPMIAFVLDNLVLCGLASAGVFFAALVLTQVRRVVPVGTEFVVVERRNPIPARVVLIPILVYVASSLLGTGIIALVRRVRSAR